MKRILKRGAIAAVTLSLLSGCSADRPGEVDEGMTAVIKQPLAYTPRGPGLGNLDYTAGELNQRISWVALNVDIPEEFPGLNNGYMFNGYFVGVFSEDNGWHGGGWSVLDISNPRVPVKMSTLKDAVWWAQYTDQRSMLTGDFRENHSTGFSIINNRWYAAIPTGHGIEIWDFTDVALNVPPTRASRTTIPNVTGGNYNNTSWQLAWQAPYVYVANTNLGITVINASNPTNPVVVSTTPTSSLGGAAVGAIYAMGNQLVISDMNNMGAVRVLDISNPTTPTLRTSHTPTENYYSSCFDGQEIFLTDRGATANLKVLSVNSTDSSISVIEADTVSNPEGLYCTTQGNSLFMGNQLNAKKFDITTPSNPVLVGTMSTGGVNADHGQVSVFGNLLYIGDDHGAGNAFMVHQQAKDLAAPRVKYVNPKSGAVTQNVKSRIGLAMTDSILIESMSTSTFIVRKQGTTTALPGFYSGTNGMINFSPSTDLQAGTTYEIVVPVGGLTDWSGNAIDQQFTSTFTTAGSSTTALAATVTSTTAVVTNTSVTFTSAGTGGTGPYQYSFNFGDGSAATAFSSTATASKTYTAPGHYNVVVTVKDSQNVTSTKAKLQIVHNPLTATLPTKSNSMALSGTNLYAVNTDSDSVTKLNADTLAQLWENVVEDEPTTVAVASNGNIWVVNQNSDKISVINSSGTDVATYTMPRGSRPFGIAFNPAGTQVYVTLEATGRLLKLDTTTGAIVSNIAVGADPRGIAVSGDGSKIYVTRHISAQTVAEVREVASSTFTVTRTINLQNDTTTVNSQDRSRGLPNYLVNIGISPDGLRAWIPSTKTNTANSSLTFETSVRTIASQINLSTGTEVFADQKDFDDSALAMDVSFSPKGDYAFFALEGNNRVIAIDAYSRANVVTMLTDSAPKGLIVNSAGTKLYVHNFLSRNVQSFDVSALTNATGSSAPELAKTSTITTEPLSAQVLTGKKIFYRASDARMSRDAYISCASCHLDGDSDRRVWDFTTRGEGFRNTRTLIGSAGTRDGRVHWTGNFDEIQDFENDIRNAFGGSGLLSDADFTTTSNPLGTTKAGRSADLDALAAYVTFLSTMPKSPYRNADGTMTAAGTAGQTVFNSKNCASCHGGAYYTNGTRHDVGTIQANSGQGIGAPLAGVGFDTPSLLGLWFGEPYLHNGQAATLSAVLNSASHGGTNTLTAQQRSDLEQFLLQIDSPAAVGTPTCSDTIKNQSESDVDCGGSSCALCATGKTCSVGTSCASGICTSGLCAAAAAGGTTYQAGATNMTNVNCGDNADGWWWMDDWSESYMQWSSVAAGSSVTVRLKNTSGATNPRLGLYINGVLKENRIVTVSTTGMDVVFNYAVTAGQSVKLMNTDGANGFFVDYITVGSGGATAVCGNSVVQSPETCDDGNTVTEACTYGLTSCTVCNSTCASVAGAVTRCGDSAVQSGNGEQCDDGNTTNTDACSNICKTPTCSDGIKNGTETNTDCGGVSGGATCAACAGAVCGNSVVQSPETCDDGNTVTEACAYALTSCTVCSSTCTNVAGAVRRCGDTVVQTANGEQCDDGNTVNTDACSNICKTPTCSDTIKNQSESDVDCGGSSCALCATGKTCSVGTSCASGICTSGLCAAAGGGTTYQAETANIRQDCIVTGTWLELDDLSSAYVQWNSVVAGTSITARVQNSGIAGTLVLYINGVSKETRTIASGTPPTDLVFNYPVAAGQAVKIAKPNTAIIEVDYIKVQ